MFRKIQNRIQINNTDNIHKLNTTQKKSNNAKYSKPKTTLVQSPFTTLGQETTRAKSTTLTVTQIINKTSNRYIQSS